MWYLIKKQGGWLTAALLLFCTFISARAQNSIGIRATPNMTLAPEVRIASDSRVYGEPRLSFEAGADYQYDIKNWLAISGGANFGIIDFNKVIVAPGDAFGDFDTPGTHYLNSSLDNYLYVGVSVAPVFKFSLASLPIHFSTGPNLRSYLGYSTPHVVRTAFNRVPDWDPNDPNDPADFELTLPAMRGERRLDWGSSIGIERPISDRSSIVLGLRHNFGLKPASKGYLTVREYSQRYDGIYNVRSSYFGFDIQLRFHGAKLNEYDRQLPISSDNQDFRKAFYVDLLGTSPLLSFNYDMRLKRHRNDGLGFRAGFGLGGLVESDYVSFERYFSVPIGVNYVFGKSRHGIEIGAGYTSQFTTSRPPDASYNRDFGNLTLGYRFQPVKDGLLVRAYLAPNFNKDKIFIGLPGISVGYSFR